MSTFRKTKVGAAGSFCSCPPPAGYFQWLKCRCGETSDSHIEWRFSETERTSPSTALNGDRTELQFHPTYSSGTAACLGDTLLLPANQYYWEFKMTAPVYGTSIMIGVGTGKTDLQSDWRNFSDLIGKDDDSWGLCYAGRLHHGGKVIGTYGKKWTQGTIVGVHLDMWRGTVEFYLNREPQGLAFRGLPSTGVYPMVSSTAAKSGMKLICAVSQKSQLQFECVRTLARLLPNNNLIVDLALPPGLERFIANNYWFLMTHRRKQDQTAETSTLTPSGSTATPKSVKRKVKPTSQKPTRKRPKLSEDFIEDDDEEDDDEEDDDDDEDDSSFLKRDTDKDTSDHEDAITVKRNPGSDTAKRKKFVISGSKVSDRRL